MKPVNAVGSTRRQRGATLIEHVVALAVLGMMVTSVFTLLSVGYLAKSLAGSEHGDKTSPLGRATSILPLPRLASGLPRRQC